MLLALLLRRAASGPKRLLFVGFTVRSSSSTTTTTTIGAAATYHTPLHPLSASTHPPSIREGIVALPPLGGARAMTAVAASGGRRRRRRASDEVAPSAGAEGTIAGDSDAAPTASPRRRRGVRRPVAAAAPPEAAGAAEGAAAAQSAAQSAAQAGMADGSLSPPASPSRRQRRLGYAIAASKSAKEEGEGEEEEEVEEEEEDGKQKGSRSRDGEKQEKDERRRQRRRRGQQGTAAAAKSALEAEDCGQKGGRSSEKDERRRQRRKQRKGLSKAEGSDEGKVEDGNERWWREQEAWAATLPPPSEEKAQRLVDGVAQHLGYRFFPHKIFLDQLPEGLTARDIARVFSRLRRPVAAPPVLPSDAGAAGEGAAGEGEEGEGVIATASSDAAVPVAPPAMEGGKVDAVVLLQAGPGARRLFPHWRGRGIDPALAPRAAVIQLGDRATYERALSDDVRIFGIVWQRHVLKPARRLGKVLRYALQSGDYAIKDIHGPGLSPLPDDDASSEERVVKGASIAEGEGGAQDGAFDGFAAEEQEDAAAAATPVLTGPYSWGWREGGAAVGVGAAGSTVRTVVPVVDGEQREGGENG